jgi:hypothetical protein
MRLEFGRRHESQNGPGRSLRLCVRVLDPKTRPHTLVDLQREPAESPEVGYTLLLVRYHCPQYKLTPAAGVQRSSSTAVPAGRPLAALRLPPAASAAGVAGTEARVSRRLASPRPTTAGVEW